MAARQEETPEEDGIGFSPVDAQVNAWWVQVLTTGRGEDHPVYGSRIKALRSPRRGRTRPRATGTAEGPAVERRRERPREAGLPLRVRLVSRAEWLDPDNE